VPPFATPVFQSDRDVQVTGAVRVPGGGKRNICMTLHPLDPTSARVEIGKSDIDVPKASVLTYADGDGKPCLQLGEGASVTRLELATSLKTTPTRDVGRIAGKESWAPDGL
jgi:hypothetical protein